MRAKIRYVLLWILLALGCVKVFGPVLDQLMPLLLSLGLVAGVAGYAYWRHRNQW